MSLWTLHLGQWSMIMATDTFGFSHDQRSEWAFCGHILWPSVRFTFVTIENLDFCHGHGQNFDQLTMVILKFRALS